MDIRIGTVEEFRSLWHYSMSNTYNYFLDNINKGIIEFWTVEVNGQFVAELYIFWDSIDKDEANGIDRAYLCAFRVQKEYQGKGIGSVLMRKVIHRIRYKGFKEVTIGIDNREYNKLKRLYEKFGFIEELKSTYIDKHFLDKEGNPTIYKDKYKIYISRLMDDGDIVSKE